MIKHCMANYYSNQKMMKNSGTNHSVDPVFITMEHTMAGCSGTDTVLIKFRSSIKEL